MDRCNKFYIENKVHLQKIVFLFKNHEFGWSQIVALVGFRKFNDTIVIFVVMCDMWCQLPMLGPPGVGSLIFGIKDTETIALYMS